ncbi:hypothetical protein GPROT1_00442 [Gammaproteobacteria bacterium]|nr:hypothetical protein GPROT1_00442 [Gammaproteobacteria bacterium]
MAGEEQPKIIIDSDWKAQAQAEKERLAAASKPATPPPGTAPAGETGEGGRQPGEPIGFKDLLSLLISQALSAMGAFPDPRTGRAMVALDLAKVYIDMLGVLEEKTKGNLTTDESTLLTRAVSELRMEFVEISREVAKAVQEGRAQSVPMSGAAGGAAGGIGPTGGVIAPGGGGANLHFPS